MKKNALDFNATLPTEITVARREYGKCQALIFINELSNMDYPTNMLHEMYMMCSNSQARKWAQKINIQVLDEYKFYLEYGLDTFPIEFNNLWYLYN